MSDSSTYVLERDFDSHSDLVWKAWTEADLVSHWYGPGVETVIHELDVKPGGQWLLEMRMGGASHYQRLDYVAVDPGVSLSAIQFVTDENWNPIPNPMMPDWPRQVRLEVHLEGSGNKTSMRMTWAPHDATEVERNCFSQAVGNMDKGWQAGMDLLAQQLESLKQP